MPNRCANYFTAVSEDTDLMAQLHDALINEHNQLDYNLAYPMPKELNTPRSPVDVIPDGTSKVDYLMSKKPFINTPKWIDEQLERGEGAAQKYIDDCLKCIQRESENKAIIEKYGTDSWYDRSINNRGCKWNCLDDVGDVLNDDHTEIIIHFDSPWSPPSEWFNKLCQMFPTIDMRLEFEEGGMGFEGTIESTGDGGTIREDRDYVSSCQECGKKDEAVVRDEDLECDICPECKQHGQDESHLDEDKISSPSESIKQEHVGE